jgi:ArsR family metal-binding transcriptional regulator
VRVERLLTTFPTASEFARAKELADRLGLPCEVVDPAEALARVAVPGLVLDTDARSKLEELAAAGVVFSGWVDYRPATVVMPEGPPPEFTEDVFVRAAIVVLAPCVADETKIRLIAHLGGDLAPALPYLNAVWTHASFIPAAETLVFMDGHRMVALYPRRITIAKADEIVDAWLTLERIRRQVNEAWARRAEIEPSFVMRRKPPPLEIFKRLPRTNCGLCGEPSCMAFAARLWSGEVRVTRCTPAHEPANRALLDALVEICAGLGLPANDET